MENSNNNFSVENQELRMALLQNAFDEEESEFINRMMDKNPVSMVSRPTSTTADGENSTINKRAETCRKSRLNNKLKKAEIHLQHQFVNEKLKDTAYLHSYMQLMLTQAEAQLLEKGLSADKLRELKQRYGIEDQGTILPPSPIDN